MSDTSILSGSVGAVPTIENTGIADAYEQESQRLARLTGFLFLVTYATSIPALFVFYAPAIGDPAFVLGEGFSRPIAIMAY